MEFQNKDIYINKDKTKCIKLSEMMYLLPLTVYLTFLILDTTTFREYIYYKVPIFIIAIMCVIVLIKMIIFDRYSRIEKILGFILFTCCCLIFLKSRFYYIVFLSIFIIGSKNVDFRKICKIYLIIGSIITIVAAIAAHFGIIEHVIRYRGDKPRYSFGSVYATDFGARIFFLSSVYCYLKYEKLNIKDSIIFIIAGLSVLYFCDARLDTICILLLALIPFIKLILKDKIYINKLIEKIMIMAIPFFALLALFLSYIYNPENKFLVLLNKILTDRLYLGKRGIDDYGFSLFGQVIQMQGLGGTNEEITNYFFIDSSYLLIALKYGIGLLIILGILYVLFIKERINKNDILLPVIMIIIGINAIVAHHFINPAYNIFMLGLFANVIKRSDIKSNIKL